MDPTCFIHSHLDQAAKLGEGIKTKSNSSDNAAAMSPFQDSSKQRPLPAQPRGSSHDNADIEGTSFDGLKTHLHLAATAIGVREISKQLGRAHVQPNIRNVLIVTKAHDNKLIKLTRELALFLMHKHRRGSKRGLVVYVDSQLRHSSLFDAESIQRNHPEFSHPFPKRRANSVYAVSTPSPTATETEDTDDGQLRYWTNDLCRSKPHIFDFVVTLGGDGTVLYTSWLFQRVVPPVLPFALGSLGFLTNFDFAHHPEVMNSVIDGGIRANLRMRFTCTVFRSVPIEEGRKALKKGETGEIMTKDMANGCWEALEGRWNGGFMGDEKCKSRDEEIPCVTARPTEEFQVLNDLVVDRGPSPYVSQLELFCDNHHMTTVQADGLTIATPTGSTAYSLSAGGSLVHPEIPAILITPICPHTLSFRPMLLPDSVELRISVPYNSRSTAWASFDGRGRIELKQGDHVKVMASKYPFPTVCADTQSTDWFHAISRTLKWNERERQKAFVVVEEDRTPMRSGKQPLESIEAPHPISAIDQRLQSNIYGNQDFAPRSEEIFDIDDKCDDRFACPPPHMPVVSPRPHYVGVNSPNDR
uniref:ATP-NAD kinase n=1 Tax=Psilocybe cubensis TaxID=181762 RepID=A0A8H7XL30_PSICU